VKRLLPLALLGLMACPEPSKGAQLEQIVTGLSHLHTWSAETEGKGQYAYDAVITSWPEIGPFLAMHLTDETATAIYEPLTGRNPKLGDICLLLLLRLTGRPWQEFRQDGVFLSTAFPNPVFCVMWEPGARARVQRRFFELLPPPER
jgi:hypothetical protein